MRLVAKLRYLNCTAVLEAVVLDGCMFHTVRMELLAGNSGVMPPVVVVVRVSTKLPTLAAPPASAAKLTPNISIAPLFTPRLSILALPSI